MALARLGTLAGLLLVGLVVGPPLARAQINPADMRSGSLTGTGPGGGSMFVVPAGRTFVLTDFTWTSYPFNVQGVGTLIQIGPLPSFPGSELWSWWAFDNSAVTPGTDHENPVGAHWTTGLVFNANVSVAVFVGGQAMPANVTWIASWSGYLTSGAVGVIGQPESGSQLGLRSAPNPSRSTTEIEFALPAATSVVLAIFDVRGRKIRTLARGDLAAGPHSIPWDGNDQRGRSVQDGMYFARLTTPQSTEVKRLTRRR